MVERRQPCDGPSVIGDDDLLTVLDTTEVLAEVVLQLAHADLDWWCSHTHAVIVATKVGRVGQTAALEPVEAWRLTGAIRPSEGGGTITSVQQVRPLAGSTHSCA